MRLDSITDVRELTRARSRVARLRCDEATATCRASPSSRSNRLLPAPSRRGSSPTSARASSRSSGRTAAISRAVRHHRQRNGQPLRVAEPLEGIADARSEAARGGRRAAAAAGRRRRVPAEPRARARSIGSDSARDALRQRYPRLIVCNLSGYGTSGPYADKKAYDLIIQSEVGHALGHRHARRRRRKVGVSIADISGGHVCLFGNPHRAAGTQGHGRRHRRWTSRSSTRSASGWATRPTTREYGGTQPPRTGASHATIAPYGPYRTCDGTIIVAVHSNREWARVLRAACSQQPALADDARFQTNVARVQHREALTAAIEAVLRAPAFAEVLRRLEAANIANARVNSMREYLQHPQLAARDCWREIDSPAGPIRALVPPVRMERRRTGDGRDSRARAAQQGDPRGAGVRSRHDRAWAADGSDLNRLGVRPGSGGHECPPTRCALRAKA